jgi:hypothetical protein
VGLTYPVILLDPAGYYFQNFGDSFNISMRELADLTERIYAERI